MERVTVRMARGDRSQPWGFGVTEAPNRDVVVVNIVGGSLADRAGLHNGDIVDQVEGLGELDINAVDRLLVTSREKIEIIVTRQSGGAARVWRPEVTENQSGMRAVFTGNPPPVDQRPYKVNLEHSNDTRPPQGFNAAAQPFDQDPRVRHLQYNSPMNIYSQSSAAEQYVQQTQGAVDPNSVPRSQEQPSYLQSETLRQIKEEENRGQTLSSHPNPQGLPVCYVCTRPILGVMARAAGHDIHGDCLACATCGNSLRNVGHHFLDGKFYCDVHGRQRRGISVVDPDLVVRSAPTAAQPVRPTEPPKGSYQPEILRGRPSVSPVPNGGSTVVTHYSTPKTHGAISPTSRGVPKADFGVDSSRVTHTGGQGYGVQYGAQQGQGYQGSPAGHQQGSQSTYQSSQYNSSTQRAVSPKPAPPVVPPPAAQQPHREAAEHISNQLSKLSTGDSQQGGQSFTRSTFERSEKTTTEGQNNGVGAGGAGAGGATHTHSTTSTTKQGTLNKPGGRTPYCEACKQQIRGAFVLAAGLAWCPEHFVCANSSCGRRLLECGFVEESGRKYCENCFEAHIAPRCAKCAKPIVSDCLNALSKKWHPTCFTCAHCHKPFGNSAFYLENGLPYCESDWNALFTTKCVSCRYPIEAGDRWVEALGHAYHSNCFSCSRCGSNLEGESFFAKNGQPFCKLHA